MRDNENNGESSQRGFSYRFYTVLWVLLCAGVGAIIGGLTRDDPDRRDRWLRGAANGGLVAIPALLALLIVGMIVAGLGLLVQKACKQSEETQPLNPSNSTHGSVLNSLGVDQVGISPTHGTIQQNSSTIAGATYEGLWQDPTGQRPSEVPTSGTSTVSSLQMV